jgi:prepilin-type N-terminal cleavage/methylation domain-containing protein
MIRSRTTLESRLCPAQAQAAGRRGANRAFTLLELLLVVAIIVIITAVAGMATQGPMARQRLRAAADTVRSDWCVARDNAMSSGETYTFRYRVRGDVYRFGPDEGLSLNDLSSQPGSSPAGTSPGSSTSSEGESSDDTLPPPVQKTLPKGIRFYGENGLAELAAMGDSAALESAGDSGTWSEPIYFYADGSTSDARVLLAADKRGAVRLSLRGVTGTVTVDDGTTAIH